MMYEIQRLIDRVLGFVYRDARNEGEDGRVDRLFDGTEVAVDPVPREGDGPDEYTLKAYVNGPVERVDWFVGKPFHMDYPYERDPESDKWPVFAFPNSGEYQHTVDDDVDDASRMTAVLPNDELERAPIDGAEVVGTPGTTYQVWAFAWYNHKMVDMDTTTVAVMDVI